MVSRDREGSGISNPAIAKANSPFLSEATDMFRSRFPHRSFVALLALLTSAGLAEAADTLIRRRVFAGSSNTHALYIGRYDNYVIVDGDGDTDLDCWLYSSTGRLVSSDTDATDTCVLPSPGIGTHRVVVRNLGDVYNDYVIWTER